MTKAYQKEVQGKASQYEETTSICIVLLVGNELIGLRGGGGCIEWYWVTDDFHCKCHLISEFIIFKRN